VKTKVAHSVDDPSFTVSNGSSCNHAGFDLDPEIIAAISETVQRWGTHPGWSRMLGRPSVYPRIEERLTDLVGAADTPVLPATPAPSVTGNIPYVPAYARLCREFDALLYVDDAHGFGVIGERRDNESSPYGMRGNAIVRYWREIYENIILVGGFPRRTRRRSRFSRRPPPA
jgi:hypothetical protein